jgi:hydroxylamine reductase (hybrid-cluster protein)
MLSKYPVLKLAYNSDGSKKDIITLLQDRAKQLENGENPETINELYKTIANQKNFYIGGLTGVKPELLALGKYIQETGTDDEFVYDLLKDRLQMKNLTPENIESLIQQQKKSAEIRRKQLKNEQEKNQQEIEREESESIKDEIGDEFKPKTEQQEKEEHQVETMWKNRFQSWDRDAVNLPNSAKRKEEAVRIMKNIEKEKELDEQSKLQELTEQEEMEGRK